MLVTLRGHNKFKHSHHRTIYFVGPPVEVLIEFKLMAFGKIREEDMVSWKKFHCDSISLVISTTWERKRTNLERASVPLRHHSFSWVSLPETGRTGILVTRYMLACIQKGKMDRNPPSSCSSYEQISGKVLGRWKSKNILVLFIAM